MSPAGFETEPRVRHAARPVVVATVAVLTLLGTATIARALFTTTATAAVSATVPTPIAPRPATVSCVDQNYGTLNLFVRARVTWTAPVGTASAPTEYVIRARDAGGTVTELVRVPGTTNVFVFQTDLLGGVLGGLINTLLAGGAQPSITVNAVFGTYESPSAYTYKLRSGGALGLTGISCLPA